MEAGALVVELGQTPRSEASPPLRIRLAFDFGDGLGFGARSRRPGATKDDPWLTTD
jgi:hypothetical protein